MAALFETFRASSMPKRLLRYALSRLDLLDEETLDMENLDLALGRTNTLEFRDAGIKLKKLRKLLNLPPSFHLCKAKVALLKVTIPIDFYTSPITVEVDGVDVRLRFASQESTDQPRRKREKSSEASEVVPNPVDLAESFLEQQPAAEKKKLEEALAAETQDPGASLAMSDFESDEDGHYGTGQALSLPAFMADFLQGIVDRLQVSIHSVTFQIDIEVLIDSAAPAPELVTLQLAIDRVNIEGVTVTAVQEGESPRVVPKEGKRHLSLDNVRAYLISEMDVFSSLARSPSLHSPVVSQTPSEGAAGTLSRESSSVGRSSDVHLTTENPQDLESGYEHLRDSEEAFDIPYEFDVSGEEQAQQTEVPKSPASSSSTPRASFYQGSPMTAGSAADPLIQPQPVQVQTARQSWDPLRDVQSDAGQEQPSRMDPAFPWEPLQASVLSSPASDTSENSSLDPHEDLAQSHLFSHEEAESMYMSAFSQTESTRLRSAMPGSWESPNNSPNSSPKARRRDTDQVISEENSKVDVESNQEHLPSQIPAETDTAPLDSDYTSAPLAKDAEPPAKPASESPPDGVATPRGPTRLVKEIVQMDSFSIYAPSTHQHISVSGPHSLGKSATPNVPGAFSMQSSVAASTASQIHQPVATDIQPEDDTLEFVLSPLEIRFDASIGFLVARIANELFTALTRTNTWSKETVPSAASGKKESKESKSHNVKITAEKISVLFLDKLAGVANSAERQLGQPAIDFQQDVLLQAILQNLRVETAQSAISTETVIDLERFRFGYADADIVSFDRQLQMRSSVRDVFPPEGADVSLKLTQYPDVSRCEITTLPLLVKVDLRRLDETFGWFGGLSSFLGMGSSMASSAPLKSTARPAPKLRGVRFDTPDMPDNTSSATSDGPENKTDARIGGVHLVLVGRDCSISLDTSAVKIASRQNLLGVTISKIRLSGPNLRNTRSEVPVVAEVSNTRLEYQPSPRDADLERLLELITPSKVKFDESDDVIMVDTLLRQRRKGPILRLYSDEFRVTVRNIAQLQYLPALGEEIARLGTVAKYLPEDDRPGLLLLGLVRKCNISVDMGGRFGILEASVRDLELAQITVPALVAVAVGGVTVTRNQIEDLIGSSNLPTLPGDESPVLMVRIIGDELEPVIKIKLRGLNLEYRVSAIMDVLDLAEDATPQDFEASLAASVANLGEQAHSALTGRPTKSTTAATGSTPAGTGKPTTVDLAIRDCIFGLNPLGLTSRLSVILTEAHVAVTLPKNENIQAVGNIHKASLLLIDDISSISSQEGAFVPTHVARLSGGQPEPPRDLVNHLCGKGYVDICQISSATACVRITVNDDDQKHVNVDLRDDLLVLETCADSTQTLIALVNALTPPTPPSKEIKFKTEVMPVNDLLASISIDAFGSAEGNYNLEDDFALPEAHGDEEDPFGDFAGSVISDEGIPDDMLDEVQGTLFDASASNFTESTSSQAIGADDIVEDDDLSVHENYFGAESEVEGTAHRWNSARNTYDHSKNAVTKKSPFKLCVRDVHVIWNLFDGYDWQHTRDIITKTVHDVETKAYERRSRAERRAMYQEEEEEEETVIGDFLFNSIYIGIAANHDPRELTQAINHNLYGDRMTETESVATTSLTATPSRVGGSHRPRPKRLKLHRSRHHKITFELQGLNVDLVAFPPGSGETQNSIDVRIQDFNVFDHVPTSTWKKFATYDQDAGERQMKSPMVHLEMLNVKPVPELAASEIVLRVTILPLRLHVDQDALDFITRFFEFKDDSVPLHASPSDVPFIQRAEVNSVPVQMDFKPKRVDYAGIRSGHTTEFMNFLILESARMTLRHTIIYGISGFDRLGKTLNDIWMPDVKRNQLPGVLAGLAPVRSLVNVGSGFKDLIEIPIREYQRDGRIVRSISKGAAAFAKTTGTELVKLGAKVATGTQYVLQGAEGMLIQKPDSSGRAAPTSAGGWEEEDMSDEERKQISLYADQPTGVVQGLRHAYTSLARDLNTARDAIIAIPAEVRESASAKGAAKAVMKRAPTIIFRPAIGATKAIGQTLLGATNTLDPQNIRRMEEKYKSGPGRM